jgi:hypothetical protein
MSECQPTEAKRLVSLSWWVRPPPFFCFSLLMTLIWSPSSLPSSVSGWTCSPEDWGCSSLLTGAVSLGHRAAYASRENGQFIHELAHLLRCDILVAEEDDATLGD